MTLNIGTERNFITHRWIEKDTLAVDICIAKRFRVF